MSALVEIKDVCKVYNPGENEVRALDHVSLTIDEQEFVAIIGHSGSGQSTLMNMLGCLDVPTFGTYRLNGRDVGKMNRTELLAKGLNDSAIHEDVMIGAADTHVTGITKRGEEVTIFENGEWAF